RRQSADVLSGVAPRRRGRARRGRGGGIPAEFLAGGCAVPAGGMAGLAHGAPATQERHLIPAGLMAYSRIVGQYFVMPFILLEAGSYRERSPDARTFLPRRLPSLRMLWLGA